MATDYTVQNARLALPYLVAAAQKGEVVTYQRLADSIGRHHRAMRHMLGYIRDEICARRRLPLITAIVVNKDTHRPGESFLPEGTASLTDEQYDRKFRELRDKVFVYQGWDALLRELGLNPIAKQPEDFDQEGREYSRLLQHRGIRVEGEPHQRPKHFVANNPGAIGVEGAVRPKVEYLFVSGDECDVVFDLGRHGFVVVEVKNGERGELIKGVYQAIKYRALMVAEKGHGEDYPVRAMLVAYELPSDIAVWATRFHVECRIVARELVRT